MPTCVRCGAWSAPSLELSECPRCSGELRSDGRWQEPEETVSGTDPEPTQPRADGPVGDGVVLIVMLFVIVAVAFVSAIVVGVLTFSVLVFLVAAVGGIVFGVMWLFGIGGISDWTELDRGSRERAYSVGTGGAPVVAVAVAVVAGMGYGWAVVAAVMPALLLGVGIWLLHRLLVRRHRPG